MGKIVNTGASEGRVIKTISVTQEDNALITELNISLSGIMRQKISEIREQSINWNNKILERDNKIQSLISLLEKAMNFIDNKGLSREFENA